jgi:hypothetical protein
MVMDIEALIAFYETEVEILEHQIAFLESGRVTTRSLAADGLLENTTTQQLESCNRRLAELQRIIKGYRSGGFVTKRVVTRRWLKHESGLKLERY